MLQYSHFVIHILELRTTNISRRRILRVSTLPDIVCMSNRKKEPRAVPHACMYCNMYAGPALVSDDESPLTKRKV